MCVTFFVLATCLHTVFAINHPIHLGPLPPPFFLFLASTTATLFPPHPVSLIKIPFANFCPLFLFHAE